MQILRDPATDAARDFLDTECRRTNEGRGRLVQAIGDCEVTYQGRATSTLHRGERLILLKPDGTLLIHTATKAKPVNWQPPGASFDARAEPVSADIDDQIVVLTALRTKPEELVQVRFHSISLLVATPLHDDAELSLVGSEDDLQRLLFENPHLVEDGFVPRRRERDTTRGYYDLDGDDADGKRVIIEVKRTTAGVKEAQQLWRYVEQVRGKKDAKKFRGMLIAPRVADKARKLLADQDLEWKELDWAEVMPQIEAMRHSGQVGLRRFGEATEA